MNSGLGNGSSCSEWEEIKTPLRDLKLGLNWKRNRAFRFQDFGFFNKDYFFKLKMTILSLKHSLKRTHKTKVKKGVFPWEPRYRSAFYSCTLSEIQ